MADGIIKRALWEDVFSRIRDGILTGRFAAGTRLTETDLAETFGTSRGPIREALRELAREGLVVELPRRGVVVSTLEDRDLFEVYSVREALELQAAHLVIADPSMRGLRGLARHLDAFEAPGQTYLERAVHDIAFHRELVRLAGNRRMLGIYEQMLTQTMLLLHNVAEHRSALRTEMDRRIHRDIEDALRARDEPAARAALIRHYQHALDRLVAN